jgi:predicted nuclease of predicted toxin-antitoxin system
VRFVVDAQLPPALAPLLREGTGSETAHVRDLGWLEASDRAIFDSLNKPGDVLVTKDADFIAMVTRSGPPPQVLWLRTGNCDNARLFVFVQAALARTLDLLGSGEPVVELVRNRE